MHKVDECPKPLVGLQKGKEREYLWSVSHQIVMHKVDKFPKPLFVLDKGKYYWLHTHDCIIFIILNVLNSKYIFTILFWGCGKKLSRKRGIEDSCSQYFVGYPFSSMFSLRFCANISWWTITPTLCTFSIFLHQI
jgi:hypothetical protein